MPTKINAINLLILDASSNDAEQTINVLRNNGHAVRSLQIVSEDDLKMALDKQAWDLFIVRDKMQSLSAEQCFNIVQHYNLDIPFIMTTKEYTIERTLDALRLGMKDVIPEDNDEYFKLVVERELSNIEDRLFRKIADNALIETTRRNELLLDSSRDAIAYITDGMHIYANHAYIELFGYKNSEELESLPIMDLMDPQQHNSFKKYLKDHAKGEDDYDFKFTGINENGNSFEAYLSLTDSKYDGENCTQVYIKTAEMNDEELAQKLKEISGQDRLTGLYNQHYFIDQVNECINKVAADNQLFAVFYIALDKFDSILDEYGITESEHYLKEVSQWLNDKLSNEAILARIGDSTFAVLYEIENKTDAEILAFSLCEQFFTHLFELSGLTIADSLSIGICLVDKSSTTPNKFLSNAHFASSRVQSKGGNGIRMHDNSLDSLENREEAQIAMEIQDILDAGCMHVIYEPIVKLHGKIQQIFLAKLAIESEHSGHQPITEAFNLVGRSSTSLKLDIWLMTESFKQFAEYRLEHANCKLKIHLSTASLLDDNLISNLLDLLSQNSLAENSVIFEFSEDDILAHLKQSIKIYHKMSENNLITSMSSFGSTADSEAVLNAINCSGLSWISIEESLFENFTTDNEAQQKVQHLLAFAHEHDLITIAPGISNAGSLATIWPMNVHHIHGDYIGTTTGKLAFDFSEASF